MREGGLSVRVYRALLRVLPRRFRAEAGEEMAQVFREEWLVVRGRGRPALAVLWLRALRDLAWVAVAERWSGGGARPAYVAEVRREVGMRERVAGLWRDVRYAARGLARSRGFTAVAVLVLGLGIGGVATIFAVVDALFLESPPHVVEPERLVRINRTRAGAGFGALAYPDYAHYRDEAASFAGLMAYDPSGIALTMGAGDARISGRGSFISDNYFDVLGVRPAAGRWFLKEEDRPGGDPRVAVISHGLWQRAYGGRRGAVGSTLTLNGHPFTVVGVAPAGFRGVSPVETPPDVWFPIHAQPVLAPEEGSWPLERVPGNSWSWLWSVGRLAEGVAVEAARSEMDALAAYLEESFAEWNEGQGVVVTAGARFHPPSAATLTTLTRLLFGVVAAVLLIACANVAILMLARGSTRLRDVGIRVAVGAGRARVMRGALLESLLLALAGGALGGAAAWWLAGAAAALAPMELAVELRPDAGVLAFAFVLAAGTAAVFGLVPAMEASRVDASAVLKGESGLGGSRTRSVLVVGQVALSLVLVVGAGLFARSLASASGMEPGFATEDRYVLRVDLGHHGYDDVGGRAFLRQALDRIRTVPGVRAAGAAHMLPFRGMWTTGVLRPDAADAEDPASRIDPGANAVSPGYFEAMGIPLLAGRGFEHTDDDRADAHPVVVNRTLARQLWPGQNPLGRSWGMEDTRYRLVGIAADAQYYELGEEPRAQIYFSALDRYFPSLYFLVHTAPDPAVYGRVRDELLALDPGLAFSRETTMREVIDDEIDQYRTLAAAVGAFGLLALVLAGAGLYGVLAYNVAGRTREIGVRVALGASGGGVARRVVGQGVALAGIGVAIGLVGALAGARLVRGMLFGVSPTDPVTLLAVPALLLAVAATAALVPALRAARVDPMEALRAE